MCLHVLCINPVRVKLASSYSKPMKGFAMQPVDPRTLTINGGSSSIKFALFEGDDLRRVVEGTISRIGLSEATLRV